MAVSWVVFHVTDRCQLNCRHCLRDPEKKPHDLSVQLMRRVMDEAKEFYHCDHIGLTGGEPTLHPQLAEILDAVVERDMTWHIVTNGVRFADRITKLFDEAPCRAQCMTAIDFSVDGATEETHDRIRGEGSYRELMKAITMCKMRDLPFMMQMTVNAYNLDQLERFALGASHLGAQRVSFGFTQPTGTYLDQEMYLKPGEWRQVQDQATRLAEVLKTPITCTEGFYQQHPFHECEPFRSEILSVDFHGNLNLCCMHADVPGMNGTSDAIANLNDVSLVDAHRKMLELIERFRKDKLDAIAEKKLEEDWDFFPCNYCMKHFAKPHWTSDGASAGPEAKRPRWRGAWSREKHAGQDGRVSRKVEID